MRLCRAKGVEAIFHKWAEVSQVIPPAVARGGHNGGEIRYATAIVEFIHNGQVTEVMANDVVFTDTLAVSEALEFSLCKSCDNSGWETTDKVAACNCCDEHEFYRPRKVEKIGKQEAD